MEDLKVSILVPIYGVEKYIRQCAISLFSQTYANIEYVFVDDCTPDNSIDILQEVLCNYPDRKKQVQIIHHQVNRGLGASRKTALAAATGDFVFNVDSDDFLLLDAVETLVKTQKKTGTDIVTGLFISLYPDGSMTEKHYQKLGKSELLKLMLAQNTITPHIWARLIRRSIYHDHHIYSVEGINMAEDYGLTPRLIFAADNVVYVDKVIYVYRLNSAASIFTKLNQQHVVSLLKANEMVWQYIQAHDHQQEYAYAVEVGMLNAWHIALKAGTAPAQISSACHYVPRGWLFRLSHLLFAHRSTAPLLRLTYLTIKWCYKRHLHYSDIKPVKVSSIPVYGE